MTCMRASAQGAPRREMRADRGAVRYLEALTKRPDIGASGAEVVVVGNRENKE